MSGARTSIFVLLHSKPAGFFFRSQPAGVTAVRVHHRHFNLVALPFRDVR